MWVGLGWDMSWCGLISGWDHFGVGYVANGLVWVNGWCGLCRCGISRGTINGEVESSDPNSVANIIERELTKVKYKCFCKVKYQPDKYRNEVIIMM